jgi:hypothetical protein
MEGEYYQWQNSAYCKNIAAKTILTVRVAIQDADHTLSAILSME